MAFDISIYQRVKPEHFCWTERIFWGTSRSTGANPPPISSSRLWALASSVVKHEAISSQCDRPLAGLTLAAHKEPWWCARRPGPEANEGGKATLTDVIIPVWLAPARGPFCAVITVYSFTRRCGRHYFSNLWHPFVFPRLHHSNCVSF